MNSFTNTIKNPLHLPPPLQGKLALTLNILLEKKKKCDNFKLQLCQFHQMENRTDENLKAIQAKQVGLTGHKCWCYKFSAEEAKVSGLV